MDKIAEANCAIAADGRDGLAAFAGEFVHVWNCAL